jgi:hypothetical protein
LTFRFAEVALSPVGAVGAVRSPAARVVALATGDGGDSPPALVATTR